MCLSSKGCIALVKRLLSCGIQLAHLWIIVAEQMKGVLGQIVVLRLSRKPTQSTCQILLQFSVNVGLSAEEDNATLAD